MKKLGAVGFASLFLFLLSAVPAIAGSELPPPGAGVGGPPPGADVGGVVVQPPGAAAGSTAADVAGVVVPAGAAAGSTAFTGAGINVTLWMVIAVALVVVGVALFVAGRRRRAAGSA